MQMLMQSSQTRMPLPKFDGLPPLPKKEKPSPWRITDQDRAKHVAAPATKEASLSTDAADRRPGLHGARGRPRGQRGVALHRRGGSPTWTRQARGYARGQREAAHAL